MRCPFCGHEETQVKDSRPTEDNSAIRRRRSCPACEERFTTFERVQMRDMRAFRDAARRAERTQQRAIRQGERLSRSIEAIDRRLARSRNAAMDLADTDAISQAADKIIDDLLGSPRQRMDFLQVPIERGPLKERTLLIPDEQIEEFLEDNALDVGTRYVRTLSSDLELTREFYYSDDPDAPGNWAMGPF